MTLTYLIICPQRWCWRHFSHVLLFQLWLCTILNLSGLWINFLDAPYLQSEGGLVASLVRIWISKTHTGSCIDSLRFWNRSFAGYEPCEVPIPANSKQNCSKRQAILGAYSRHWWLRVKMAQFSYFKGLWNIVKSL